MCPWNVSFTTALGEAALKGSAIKRAKLWMLKRNACVLLGKVGTHEDLAVLEAMLVHEHEIVRGHAASAMARLKTDRATWSDTRLTPGRRMRAP